MLVDLFRTLANGLINLLFIPSNESLYYSVQDLQNLLIYLGTLIMEKENITDTKLYTTYNL